MRILNTTITFVALLILSIGGACKAVEERGIAPRMDYGSEGSIPGFTDVPFPTDLWRAEDGQLTRIPDLSALFDGEADTVAAQLGALDGFGTRSQVQFPITGPLDGATLPALTDSLDDALVVINLDTNSMRYGEAVPYEWHYDSDDETIRGAPVPGEVLESGATYGAVVTNDIVAADGAELSAAPELKVLRSSDPPQNLLRTAEGLSQLDAMPELDGRITGVTVFRVQDAFGPLLRVRAMLEDSELVPAPNIEFAEEETIFLGADALDALLGDATRAEEGPRAGKERWGHGNPTGLAHDHVGVVATGTIHLPRFRRESTGTLDAADGTFELDSSKTPRLQSMMDIPITVALPAAPPPESGYPVVLFGHGLGSSRHAVMSFAEPLTSKGIAVFAIDFDGHGSRFNDRDRRNNTAETTPDFQGDSTIRDGFGDVTGLMTVFDFLGALRNFSRARDGIRQSVLDISSVTIALRSGSYDLAPLVQGGIVPTLDTTKIAYMGESFGTLVGGVLAAIEPDIELYIFDVPAAGIIDLAIVNSPALASLLLPLTYSIFGWVELPKRTDAEISILQAMVDAADPLTFAPHVLRERLSVAGQTLGPRHVVALEVLGDESIHNIATDSLARAMGLELLVPFAVETSGLTTVDSPATANVDGQTGVIVQYGPAAHGENWSSERGRKSFVPGFPHLGEDPFPRLEEPLRLENPLYETLDQVLEVLLGHQAGEAPSVRSTIVPVL